MPQQIDSPTLILLPGLHGTADLFPPLLAAIPPHFPTKIITHPNNRLSNYPTLLRLLEDQLRDQNNLILIAESFSGPLALQFAAAHPNQVQAVILCATFIKPPVPRLLCFLAAPLILLHFPLPGFLIRMFLAGRHAPRNLVREARRTIFSIPPSTLAHRVALTARINAQDALQKCTVPILCLAATRDRLIGTRSARRIKRARPDVPIRYIKAPHFLLQTHPAEAWHEINSFLATLNVLQSSST